MFGTKHPKLAGMRILRSEHELPRFPRLVVHDGRAEHDADVSGNVASTSYISCFHLKLKRLRAFAAYSRNPMRMHAAAAQCGRH